MDETGKQIFNKYMDRAEALLYGVLTTEEEVKEIVDIIADCVEESVAEGKKQVRFPFQIAELQEEAEIEDLETGQGEHHYFWDMLAGFASMDEAADYIGNRRTNNPGKKYSLFVNGIPRY